MERSHHLLPRETVEVILVVDRRQQPVTLGTQFIPGEIVGTAYLYDHSSARILCAGHVAAHSSGSVEYSYYQRGVLDTSAGYAEASDSIRRDFAIEVERAIAMSMDDLAGPVE